MATAPLTDETTRDDYVATGGQTTFPYTFWVRDEDHLDVFVNGVLQTIGAGNDYTVTAVQSVTGSDIVFNSGLTLNDAVAIVYNPDVERATDFSTGGSLRASSLNLELTYGLSLIQYLKTQLSRVITFNPSDPLTASLVLPQATANNVIGWNSSGDGLTNFSFASLSSAIDTDLSGISDGDGLAYNLATDLFEPTALVSLADNNTFTGDITFSGDVVLPNGVVDYADIQNVANYKVLGNVSGGAAAPSEVSVLDEDNMASDSATALATQQSIKAYVDAEIAGIGGSFTPSYESAQTSYTNGTVVTFTHGLGAIPEFYTVEAVCLTAEADFAIGDRYSITQFNNAASNPAGGLVTASSTEIKIRVSANGLGVANNAGGYAILTPANFRLIAKGWI